MRTATIVSLMCVAGALGGCGTWNGGKPGSTVEFVASNPDSVLLDFGARPTGELTAANDAANQQCQLFSHRAAVLESLNVREAGTIRATYLCKGGARSADASSDMRRRK